MNLDLINKQILFRKNELIHYSPISFFRNPIEKSYNFFVKTDIIVKLSSNNFYSITIADEVFNFIYENLAWDSDFFKMPTIKLSYILFNCKDYSKLLKAINSFKKNIIRNNYVFIEIPSEDIFVIQALNESLFRLVETRMTYYLELNTFNHTRFSVREATINDIENLKRVSSEMVNPYDRFHADICFKNEIADSFLGVFAEESVKGFADYVMVPNEKDIPSDSFLTAKYNKNWWNEIDIKVSKMVLSAVSSSTNRGWYIKLISEMAYHLKEQGADYALMHPASTNKAVIHSYEKLGCKLGKVSHILSFKKND